MLTRTIGVSHECVGDDSCAVCGAVLQCTWCLVWQSADPHLAELVLLTYSTSCVFTVCKELTMSTTSLPAGATVSPSALGEPHTTTQHTVTGECVHFNWCTSEAVAVKLMPTIL